MKILTNLVFEPKGLHNPAQAYNVKDTVMSADGSRVYFALQDVPADVQLDDAEYWICQIDLSETKSDMDAATNAANAAAANVTENIDRLSEEIDTLTNKKVFTPPIGKLALNSGIIEYNDSFRGCTFRVKPNTAYKITTSGRYNRFIVSGIMAEEAVAGVSADRIEKFDIAAEGTSSVIEYEYTNANYNYLCINLGYIHEAFPEENFSATISVEENVNEKDFRVSGVAVLTKDHFPGGFIGDKKIGNINNTVANDGKVETNALYMGSTFKVMNNSTYKITVHGNHNRFIVSGVFEDVLMDGNAVYTLYNSGDLNTRETSEYCIVQNSAGYKNFIVTVGVSIKEPPTVEYIEDYIANEIIKFDTFDLYTAKKVDALLAPTATSGIAYVTERNVNDVNTTAEVFALYDALMAKYPAYISKNALGQNSLGTPLYEYVFSSGNYNEVATQRNKDEIKAKPVILVLSGVHGYERSAVMATYQFFRDMVNFSADLYALREGLTFKVIPVVTPYSFDNNTRVNENGVNINRNFDYNWALTANDGNNYSGAAAADQVETQIVQAWMQANASAYLCIDHHNSGYDNEVSMISGLNTAENIPEIKEQYLHGLAKVIPYWKGSKGFSDSLVFAYTGFIGGNAMSVDYSQGHGITSVCLETSWNQNSSGKHSAETIATGAEALGNMLLEIYDNIE